MSEISNKLRLTNPIPETPKISESSMPSLQDLLVSPVNIKDFQEIRESNPGSRDVVDALILKQLKERLDQLKRMTVHSLNRTQQEMIAKNVDEMERVVAAMEDGKNIARMNPRYIWLINPKAPGYEKMALDAISGEKAVFLSIDSKLQKNPDFINRALKVNPLVIDYIGNLAKLDKETLKSVYEYFFKNQNLLSTLDENKEFILGFIAQYKELSVTGKWDHEPLSIQNLPKDIDKALASELSPVMQLLLHRHKSINTLGTLEKAYLSILEENPSDIEHLESARKNPNFVLELLRSCKERMASGKNIPPSYRQVNLSVKGKEPYTFAYILRYADDSVKRDHWFIRTALKEGLIDERDLFEILSQDGNYEFIRDNIKDFPASARLLEKLSGNIDELVKRAPESWTPDDIKRIKDNPWLLANISPKIAKSHERNLRTLTLQIVSLRGSAIAFAPESLKKDREVALAAVKQNGIAIRFIHSSLKKDRDITFEAIKNTGYAFKFIDARWKKDEKFLLECAKIEKTSISGSSEYAIDDKDEISVRNEKLGSFGAKYICEALAEHNAQSTTTKEIIRTLAERHGSDFGEIIFKDTQSFKYISYIHGYYPELKNDKTFLKLVLSYRLEKNDKSKKDFFDKIMATDLKNIVEGTRLFKSAEQKNEQEKTTTLEHRRWVFCEFLKGKKGTSKSIEKILKIAENSERFAEMYQYINSVASEKSSQQEMFDKLKTLFSDNYTTDDIDQFIKNLFEFEIVRIEIEKKKKDEEISKFHINWSDVPDEFKEKYLLKDGHWNMPRISGDFKLHTTLLSEEDRKRPDRWVGSFFESKGFNNLKLDPLEKERLKESLGDTSKQIEYSTKMLHSDVLANAMKNGKRAPTFEEIIDAHPDVIKKVVLNWDQYVRSDSIALFTQSEKIVLEREEKEQTITAKKVAPETTDKKENIPTGKSVSPEEISKYYAIIPSGKIVPVEWGMTFEMWKNGVGAIRSRSGFEITTKSQNDLTWAIHSMEFLKSVGLDFLGKEGWEAFIEWVSGKLREHNLPALDLAQGPSEENKKILLGFFECIINNGHLPKTTLDSLENKYSQAVNLHRPIRDVMKNKKIRLGDSVNVSLTDDTGKPKPEAIRYALKHMHSGVVDPIYHMPKAA